MVSFCWLNTENTHKQFLRFCNNIRDERKVKETTSQSRRYCYAYLKRTFSTFFVYLYKKSIFI